MYIYRFAINLQIGPMSGYNTIGIHFNPRFDEDVIVRNTRIGATWGEEERDCDRFPFARGQDFNIRIRVLEDK